jgi:hypothetical protein
MKGSVIGPLADQPNNSAAPLIICCTYSGHIHLTSYSFQGDVALVVAPVYAGGHMKTLHILEGLASARCPTKTLSTAGIPFRWISLEHDPLFLMRISHRGLVSAKPR